MKEFNKEQKKYVVELFKEFEYLYTSPNNDLKCVNHYLKEKGLLEEEFEVGKWYKHNKTKKLWFIESLPEPHSQISYGFTANGNWDKSSQRSSSINEYKKATKEEVEEALIKEAKKRYSTGVFKCLHDVKNLNIEDVLSFKWSHRCLRYHTEDGCGCCFDSTEEEGRMWASEIIEPKTKELTLSQIEDKFGCKVKIVK